MFFNFFNNKVSCLLLLCLVGVQPLFAAEDNLSFRTGKEGSSTVVMQPTVLAPAAPSNVKARPSLVGAITISWNEVPAAQQYIIEYAGKPTGIFKQLAVVNAPTLSFRHTGLSYDQTVYYRVKASDGSSASAYSPVVSGKTFSKGHVFKIMPLGDSNTKGSNSVLPEDPANSSSQNEAYFYAYRKKLFQLLAGASVSFDYVGDERSGYASKEFSDYDHAGYGGARVRDIADLLEVGKFQYYNENLMRGPGNGPYLDDFNPDIILLHIGTNWVLDDQATIDELENILELIDAYEARANKEVTVVLARIIKRCQDCTEQEPADADKQDVYTRVYNENLWKLAGERIAIGDRLIRVDMETGAGINYFRNQGNDMLDYLHLTDAGYAKMAQVWYNALKNDLTVTPPPLDTKAPETTIATKPDALTKSKTASFSFTSDEADATYQLSWNGSAFEATANPRTFTDLADGAYTIAVRAIDKNDNVDATPATYTWVVDTKAPSAPVVTVPADNALLNINRPSFAGTAEPLSKVTILVDGKAVGTATADAQGKWSFQPGTALAEGSHQVNGTATDVAGNTSAAGSAIDFTLDLTPPAAPVILAISEDTGTKNNDHITNDKTLRFSGTADAGSQVSLSETNIGKFATFTASSNGTWEYSYEGISLAEKGYNFKATAEDKAGNISQASSNFAVRVDLTAPAGYTVKFNTTKVDLNNMKSVGLEINNAEADATYFYSITSNNGGTEVTGTEVASRASFTTAGIDVSGLKDGKLTVSLYLVDVAGNKGQAVTAEVIKQTKDIIAVQEFDKLTVDFKTPFSEVPLPTQVEVSYSDNTKEVLSVTWQQGNYNGEVPAAYTLKGALELKPNTSNSANRMASIVVEVKPNEPPTDIALSGSSFQPNIKNDEAIGSFTTTDPDDQVHTYTLVSGEGDTDNSLFEIRDNELFLISNKGLSGNTDFVIRVSSTDPYDNKIEKAFKLKKETYKSKIKLANAFSPDGDGINDTWIIPELRFFNNIEIQIFDRAGTRIFQTTDPENGWDGRNKSGEVEQGAYFFILNVKDTGLVQKGVVTVIK